MRVIRPRDFTASQAWGAVDIALMNGISIRLQWTDRPYHWHVNDGEEVFVVVNGAVDMHYRDSGAEKIVLLETGDVFFCRYWYRACRAPTG